MSDEIGEGVVITVGAGGPGGGSGGGGTTGGGGGTTGGGSGGVGGSGVVRIIGFSGGGGSGELTPSATLTKPTIPDEPVTRKRTPSRYRSRKVRP